MNAIVLRSGHIVDSKKGVDPSGHPLESLTYARGGWVCRYDLADACLKAVDSLSSGYAAFHIIGSIQAEDNFDIKRTEHDLGLTFQARFEQYK
jgi:hypothetical protein